MISSELGTMYATKRRRRSVKAAKPPMKDPPKSNPSKRHRLRLNSELDHLASLLPFEQSVISKLDKLSILRLAVSYLRTKSFFQTAIRECYALQRHHHRIHHSHHLYAEPSFTDTDCVLQALSGFLFVVTCDGEVFFASRTVEQYLGFHQSDIIHQSALELIHSEDREEFKTQLNWRSQLPQDQQDLTMQQLALPENSHLLQRCFTVRFRCLLDNTSGFITLEICGRIKCLQGQSLKGEEPPLALFALCCPFGPLPLLDVPPRDYTFKSKHKMDMAPLSMDPRGKLLFGYSDRELIEKGGYDLLHPDDLTYYAAAHQELIKTGSSGLIAYRLLTKDFRWMWLQTSSKVIYKNSKPDFVICTHRHLTEDEGRDLVGKRGSEFKLPYPIIDTDPTGLGAALEEEDISKLKSPRNKKSKGQLRDYLQAGRKRKTPYRDVYSGYNGYPTYPSLNGYSACPSDMKTEFMYPYAGQNFAALDPTADIYRSGYHPFASTMYPAPTTDGFRLDGDKPGYANGYYLEPRQYQHTLQYHGNGYTDLMSHTGKYGYDVTKYGYDHMGGYGLDLTKRAHYEEDLSRYETDLRKYSHDYSSDKVARVNGSYDPLRTGSLYGTNPILNNEGLLSCSTSHATTSPCSLYRTDVDRYQNGSLARDHKILASPAAQQPDCKQQIPNGHTSVIRNASPRIKSPPGSEHATITSSMYQSGEGSGLEVAPTWVCSNNTPSFHCKSVLSHSSSESTSGSPLQHVTSNITSRIVSPGHSKHNGSTEGSTVCSDGMTAQNTPSPASATTATSVIQMSGRARSCEKQVSMHGGIAVPVVKSSPSSSSWLHLPTASSYDWHMPSSDYSGHHQRALPTADYSNQQVAVHTRAIVETPKYASLKAGEKSEDSNPLLSFSQVTHTLLSSN